MTDNIAEARAEIQRLHNAWFTANGGLHGEMLKDILAGEEFFNYNLNGYTYYGLAEMEKLWAPEHMGAAFELRGISNEQNLRIEATETMGWLTVEADVELRMKEPGGSGEMRGDGEVVVMPFRITECYRRDDGTGRSIWRMWHFHCSQVLADGGKRFVSE
ncbi:MAG TPA: hypothetical protein VFE65_15770 [Pseudonocardia sp.]|jgi:hypothetical protein|nr:hypothetical protein [Pseudonocardia sp.]